MYSETLEVGMKINIEMIDEIDEDKVNIYPSQILDILENDEFIIMGPIRKTKLVFLHEKDKIHITYNIEDKGKHYFTCKILARSYTNIYMLKVKKISPIAYIQSRAYFRLETNIPVIKEFSERFNDENKHIEECLTKDISGGGIKLYSNLNHSINDIVECKFNILNHEIIAECQIIRIEEVYDLKYKYIIGLSFLDINEKNRDLIIKYIYREQRKLISKGLIK